MASSLLHPPAHLAPSVALRLSQQAPYLLRTTPSAISPYSISSLWSSAESPELWTTYENLMLSCLRTGDEQSAHTCLERLTERFGAENERLMALRGLFQEAIAKDDDALKKVLKEYENILVKDPANMPVSKRRIALLRSLNRTSEAITALNKFLDASPTDAEAWSELADLYVTNGMFPQAIFALEEVLLVTPNAWNIHARLGEVLYMAASSETGTDKHLPESMRRFCRSIELCDDYLRGYYGLKLTTSKLLTTLSQSQVSRQSKGDTGLPPPDIKDIERLNELATAKLSEIVRRNTSGEAGWEGYEKPEIIAAQELLNRDAAPITR
ncbi:TPR repeat protein oca3 [Lachnellula suecica]|uniref:ER membrane protein complex subunit 2 n=1 Tax=Lachnellula suecica TaxID=602035 RepID=A0A8T9BW26_9HELO|nr:TPR repeat protein oca3 [Lachnellula suecica]